MWKNVCAISAAILFFSGECKEATPPVPLEQNCTWSDWFMSDNSSIQTGNTHQIVYFEKTNQILLINGGPEYAITASQKTQLYEWAGNNWRLVDESGPERRNWFTPAYDSNRQVLVLYGGHGADRLFDTTTWEWDGYKWTAHQVAGPGPREAARMAYDAIQKRIILFGGSDDQFHIHGDTWAWNGTNWTKLNDANAPSPRFPGALFYDPISGKTYLYGGHFASQTEWILYKDFWRLDGDTWTKIDDNPPPGILHNSAVTYITNCKLTIFAGGTGGPNADSNEFQKKIWTWDGTKFALFNKELPNPRSGASLAYDTIQKKLMLHGGFAVPGGRPGNNTWITSIKK